MAFKFKAYAAHGNFYAGSGGTVESPKKPTGLSADALSDTAIRLSWNFDANAAYFKIYRDGLLIESSVTNLYFDDMGLTEETTYEYKIKASNDGGDSAFSTSVYGITKAKTTLLGRMQTTIENLISNMSIADGYWYDWKSATTEDRIQSQAVAGEAWAWIRLDDGEDNNDNIDASDSYVYSNEARYIITAQVGMTGTTPDNPKESYKEWSYKLVEDLKKLFGINFSFEPCQLVRYTGYKIINESAGDIFQPAKIEFNITARYEQSRLEPNYSR